MTNKRYCDDCNKYISNITKHNKTKTHKVLSESVVKRFVIRKVSLKNRKNIIFKHIVNYRKFSRKFDCNYEIYNKDFHQKKFNWGFQQTSSWIYKENQKII